MSGTAPDGAPWADEALAALLFAVDPAGLGGISLHAPASPARDRWLADVRSLFAPAAPWRRVPLNIAESRLLGGLDLAATLAAGRPVAERGLLADADGGVAVLPMAERLSPAIAAHINAALDSGESALERDGLTRRSPARFGVIALDEGIGDDERPPAALLERLAFHAVLQAIPQEPSLPPIEAAAIEHARRMLPEIAVDGAVIEALCAAALALGVDSMRATILALRAARAHAALFGRGAIEAADAAAAARLVLAPRATQLPEHDETAEDAPEEPPPQRDEDDGKDEASPDMEPEQALDDLILAAALAAIPAGLLAQLKLAAAARSRGAGKAGAKRKTMLRGRPAGIRAGAPRRGARLNIIETLRAAAPWQTLRRRQKAEAAPVSTGGDYSRLEIRAGDFRVTRFKQRSQSLAIFAVDASGSQALNRLAEAKGAVELLLADCYVRRDQAALIAFRGQNAEVLLPPTRSLTRAKRCLAGLPGGGGTPLAAGIDCAAALADAARRKGQAPFIILLTDGRANIARGGAPGRERASEDALAAAHALRAAGFAAILIDASARPNPQASILAAAMGAVYVALPYADAASLSATVRSAGSKTNAA